MIYLDNAATSFPKPNSVIEAVRDCLQNNCANPGRAGHRLALQGARQVYECRELLASFFRIEDPLRLIFTSNGTDSLNVALKGSLKSGDHVITTVMEHNSVLRPLATLEQKGVKVTVLPCTKEGKLSLEDVKKAIRPESKLVVTTHASNLTGGIFDIKEIGGFCREKGLLYLVDAAQSAGVLDLDVQDMKIDMLAAPGHKSLFAMQGTGVLYVGERCKVETLKEGGTGSNSFDSHQPDVLPDKYESGTLNLPGILSLGEGLSFINQEGIKTIREKESELSALFLEKVLNIDGVTVYGGETMEQRVAVIALNLEGLDSSELAFRLDEEYDICTRSGFHCAPLAHQALETHHTGSVRFSIGYFNTKEEILNTVDALYRISKNG